jgi:hypothetical protein
LEKKGETEISNGKNEGPAFHYRARTTGDGAELGAYFQHEGCGRGESHGGVTGKAGTDNGAKFIGVSLAICRALRFLRHFVIQELRFMGGCEPFVCMAGKYDEFF